MQKVKIFVLLLILFFCSGCESFAHKSAGLGLFDTDNRFSEKVSQMADQIVLHLKRFDISTDYIAMSTFLDINNFSTVSELGLIISEELSVELYKRGFNMRELRQMLAVEISDGKGEIFLSRDSRKVFPKEHISAVVSGSYYLVGERLILSARVLNSLTAELVSIGKVDLSLSDLSNTKRTDLFKQESLLKVK